MSALRRLYLPVKLNDAYTCQGTDANGDAVVFGDLLYEGQSVATFTDRDGQHYGPFATVIRRADGLWVESDGPFEDGDA